MIYLGNETYEFRNGMKFNTDELRLILEELEENYKNDLTIENLLDKIFIKIKKSGYEKGYDRGYEEGFDIGYHKGKENFEEYEVEEE